MVGVLVGMLRELAVCLAAVTWWTAVTMRWFVGILVLWWAAVGLGLVEGSRGFMLILNPLAWGLGGASAVIWLWGARTVWRAWVGRNPMDYL